MCFSHRPFSLYPLPKVGRIQDSRLFHRFRTLFKSCLGLWLLFAVCPGVSNAQDEIQYFDRAAKSIVTVQAIVEQENGSGLRFRTGARTEPVDVPAQDLTMRSTIHLITRCSLDSHPKEPTRREAWLKEQRSPSVSRQSPKPSRNMKNS